MRIRRSRPRRPPRRLLPFTRRIAWDEDDDDFSAFVNLIGAPSPPDDKSK